MLKIEAKIGLEPILKDLQSNTLTKLCYSAYQKITDVKFESTFLNITIGQVSKNTSQK